MNSFPMPMQIRWNKPIQYTLKGRLEMPGYEDEILWTQRLVNYCKQAGLSKY